MKYHPLSRSAVSRLLRATMASLAQQSVSDVCYEFAENYKLLNNIRLRMVETQRKHELVVVKQLSFWLSDYNLKNSQWKGDVGTFSHYVKFDGFVPIKVFLDNYPLLVELLSVISTCHVGYIKQSIDKHSDKLIVIDRPTGSYIGRKVPFK